MTAVTAGFRRGGFYAAVTALSAGMVTAQVAIMRVFAIGSWAHFGSLIIAIALAGFSLSSAIMCVAEKHFERQALAWATGALLTFGPILVIANASVQALGFNPIFLAATPQQFWLLLGVSGLYFLPFLAAALFLGAVFLIEAERFGRIYFADLMGSGLGGLFFLGALVFVPPSGFLFVPLGLWFVACLIWAWAHHRPVVAGVSAVLGVLAVGVVLWLPTIATSPYKGVSYARHFPDAQLLYDDWAPQGYVELYSSSYFHFAPGLSDMAAIDLPSMPDNAYLGIYLDGDGPIGAMRPLPQDQLAYLRYLPMAMPYLLRPHADAFIVQFGGGISTRVALGLGASKVVVAESNPLIPKLFRDPKIGPMVDNLLSDPRVSLIPTEGRIAISTQPAGFDVVDFSLVDSTGLSSPGGLSISEKYAYSQDAMEAYMRALKPGGILAVTVWNKESPPKAVPKLMATLFAAAKAVEPGPTGPRFFIAHTYLSTATILYRRGGFTPDEIKQLQDHAKHMAFDVVWSPDQVIDAKADDGILANWTDPLPPDTNVVAKPAGTDGAEARDTEDTPNGPDMTVTSLYRAMADLLATDQYAKLRGLYGFSITPVTDEHPYLAGYIKPPDIVRAIQNFSLISDDWGFLLLWVTLAQSIFAGVLLIGLPALFGWRTIFAHQPGKLGLLGYFACLGLGYILVEVTLIAKFVRVLGNPTISASVMLTGMLVLSGLGSLASTRIQANGRRRLPPVLVIVAILLASYAALLDPIMSLIATLSPNLRLVPALLVVALPSFPMGFAMPTAMTSLKLLGKERFFLWAWGINGLFSVVGAVAAPLIGILFGLNTALWLAAICYLLAVPCFFSVLRPRAAL